MSNGLTPTKKRELDLEVEAVMLKFKNDYPQFGSVIPDSFEAAEELGFFVISTEAPFNLSGLTTTFDEKYSLIAVNSKHTKGRQNFSIWHEIYHWYTKDGQEISLYGDVKYSETEYRADTFAAYMLIDKDILREELEGLNLSNYSCIKNVDILKLQYKFQVSTTAIIRRIVDLTGEKKIWSRKKTLRKFETHKEFNLSGDLAIPTGKTYISPSFFNMLLKNFEENKISEEYVRKISEFIEGEF